MPVVPEHELPAYCGFCGRILEAVVVNQTGDAVISGALTALQNLQSHLSNGQASAVSNEDLSALDDCLSTVTQARAEVGSKQQQLQNAQSAYATAKTQLTQTMSNTVDTDIAQATVQLQSAQVSYNSALYATKISFQTSLVNFLTGTTTG